MSDSGRHDDTAPATTRAGAHPAAASNLRVGLACLAVVLLVIVVVEAAQSGSWGRLLVQLVGIGCLVVAAVIGGRAGARTPYGDGGACATDAQVLRRRLALLALVLALVATGLFLLQAG